MRKENFTILVDKYLAGSASESERALLEAYLQKMESAGQTSFPEQEETLIHEQMWNKITVVTTQRSKPKKRILSIISIAAAACILAFVVITKPWRKYDTPDLITVNVAQGKPIKKLKLPDGTLVWVKPQSSLTYGREFMTGSRKVDLSGEALFEIAPDALSPFVVHSKNMEVRVLGTSFNINDGGDRDTVEVAVLTGRVSIAPLMKSDIDTIELAPFQKLVLNKKSGRTQKGVFLSSALYTGGTQYDMSFMNAPLPVIVKRIEDKFDIIIKVDTTNQSKCSVSGDFTDQSLQHTVEMLSRTLGATYSINGDTVKISGLGCK